MNITKIINTESNESWSVLSEYGDEHRIDTRELELCVNYVANTVNLTLSKYYTIEDSVHILWEGDSLEHEKLSCFSDKDLKADNIRGRIYGNRTDEVTFTHYVIIKSHIVYSHIPEQ